MPTNPGLHAVDLPDMSAKVVGTPEYILPFLLEIRAGWLENRLDTTPTLDLVGRLNIIILNTELMIENNLKKAV